MKSTLKEICIDVLKDNVDTVEDAAGLGLPRSLEDDLCNMIKKTSLETK